MNNIFQSLISVFKRILKQILPAWILKFYRKRTFFSYTPFILDFSTPYLSFRRRLSLVKRLEKISENIPCSHKASHILPLVRDILAIPPERSGYIVEAGCYKGGSTSKFSIVAKIAGRKLIVLDSFKGIPKNQELHDKSIMGHSIHGWFAEGAYTGTINEVRQNIKEYGEIQRCEFIEGWFEDTMPKLSMPIVATYLDVDLASSTKTCLKYLYPLLVSGGVLYSQDGDFPLVIEVFKDENFWEEEVGCKKPHIEGLGKQKLLKITKD